VIMAAPVTEVPKRGRACIKHSFKNLTLKGAWLFFIRAPTCAVVFPILQSHPEPEMNEKKGPRRALLNIV